MLDVCVSEGVRHAVVLGSGTEVDDVIQLDGCCTLLELPQWVDALFHKAFLAVRAIEESVVTVQEAVHVGCRNEDEALQMREGES